jgi:quercetin dioxygenase-like cupin family protein
MFIYIGPPGAGPSWRDHPMRLRIVALLSLFALAACHQASPDAAPAAPHAAPAAPQAPFPTQVFAFKAAPEGAKAVHVEVLLDHGAAKLAQVTLQPGAAMPAHAAPVPVTVQALSGQGELEIEGTRHPLRPGQIITMAAGAQHAVYAGEGEALVLLLHYLRGGAAPAAHDDHHHH